MIWTLSHLLYPQIWYPGVRWCALFLVVLPVQEWFVRVFLPYKKDWGVNGVGVGVGREKRTWRHEWLARLTWFFVYIRYLHFWILSNLPPLSQSTCLFLTFLRNATNLRQERICLQCRRPRFDPLVRKLPWRRAWPSTAVLLPGEFHRQRSLVGCSPWVSQSGAWLSD